MKSVTLIVQILVFALSFSAYGFNFSVKETLNKNLVYESRPFTPRNIEISIPLSDYLSQINPYDLQNAQFEKYIFEDPTCGDAYFINFKVHGFWQHVQAEVSFYAQTLTQESLDRLYNAIVANYPTKGLPQCLLNDLFYEDFFISFLYHYDPDYTTVNVPAQLQPVPADFPCSENIRRPLTSCWNVENPYAQ